ncbi:hypothetical protein A2V82_02740 [candidate division KSB1 bacterium RBG_16_48_16]|nr:MAG: hypothetical protein A2V82_02740 [candidate division KSB1 bacterium RBG_16_48_16]
MLLFIETKSFSGFPFRQASVSGTKRRAHNNIPGFIPAIPRRIRFIVLKVKERWGFTTIGSPTSNRAPNFQQKLK